MVSTGGVAIFPTSTLSPPPVVGSAGKQKKKKKRRRKKKSQGNSVAEPKKEKTTTPHEKNDDNDDQGKDNWRMVKEEKKEKEEEEELGEHSTPSSGSNGQRVASKTVKEEEEEATAAPKTVLQKKRRHSGVEFVYPRTQLAFCFGRDPAAVASATTCPQPANQSIDEIFASRGKKSQSPTAAQQPQESDMNAQDQPSNATRRDKEMETEGATTLFKSTGGTRKKNEEYVNATKKKAEEEEDVSDQKDRSTVAARKASTDTQETTRTRKQMETIPDGGDNTTRKTPLGVPETKTKSEDTASHSTKRKEMSAATKEMDSSGNVGDDEEETPTRKKPAVLTEKEKNGKNTEGRLPAKTTVATTPTNKVDSLRDGGEALRKKEVTATESFKRKREDLESRLASKTPTMKPQHAPKKVNAWNCRRPRANSTDVELQLPQGGLFDEAFAWERHFSSTSTSRRQAPCGLHNMGNTCYLNATLQCLAHLPALASVIVEQNKAARLTRVLQSVLRRMQQQQATNPREMVQMLPRLGGGARRTSSTSRGYRFRPGRQEDAHEFLVHLLDGMHEEELEAAGIDIHASGWRDRLPIARLDETTMVHRMFGGYYRSQVQCTNCRYCSNTYDPFLDLSLEISGSSCGSVQAALSNFTRAEVLDSANRWKCDDCQKRVCARKQLTIFRPPLTLCLQLKRFAFGGGVGFSKWNKMGLYHGGSGAKITKPIEFPAVLKLPLSDGRKCEYRLQAVILHVGPSATSGHYTALVRPHNHATWYHVDDDGVRAVSEQCVLRHAQNAYILFYSRQHHGVAETRNPPTPPNASSSSAPTRTLAAKSTPRGAGFGLDQGKERKTANETATTRTSTDVGCKLSGNHKDNADAKTRKQLPSAEALPPLLSSERADDWKEGTSSEVEPTREGMRDKNRKSVVHGKRTSANVVVQEEKHDDTAKSDEPIRGKHRESSASRVVPKTDAGTERESVHVVVRKKRSDLARWKPPTSVGKTVLLGNHVHVGQWDDHKVGGTAFKGRMKRVREQALERIVLEQRERKKDMRLDKWDEQLDQGKRKKVKGAVLKEEEGERKTTLKPEENPFHRLQRGKKPTTMRQPPSMKKKKRSGGGLTMSKLLRVPVRNSR